MEPEELPGDRNIARLIHKLARVELNPANTCNPYAYHRNVNAIRRHNLFLYLQRHSYRRTPLLLVGEAAGYRGCALTGIPFTSEAVLLQEFPSTGLFGIANGYRRVSDGLELSQGKAHCVERSIAREATSTMVWEAAIAMEPLPLFWNAFPFHPFQPANPLSNRTPTASELSLGATFLQDIMELFAIADAIAVGNRAAGTLTQMGIPHSRVRHPARGGKAAFLRGIFSSGSRAPKPLQNLNFTV